MLGVCLARLYVGSMIAHCSRCGGPAGVVMVFNYTERQVWLDDLVDPETMVHGYPLCDTHADRFTPPMGWRLSDLRQPVRPLFVGLLFICTLLGDRALRCPPPLAIRPKNHD